MTILKLLAKENFIAYSKPLAKKIGIDEAILFGDLCSMCNLYGEEFFCEQQRICDDTCLTEYRVRNAMKNLQKHGLVAIEKKGLPAKNYYTLSESKFIEIIGASKSSAIKFDTTGDAKFDSTSDDDFDSTFNKNQSSKNKSSKNQNNIYIDEFETLWKLYPNKKGKDKALSFYIKARKDGETYEAIQKGVMDYSKECLVKAREKQYIKHGSTWFGNSGWKDEYDFTPSAKGKTYGANGIEINPNAPDDLDGVF